MAGTDTAEEDTVFNTQDRKKAKGELTAWLVDRASLKVIEKRVCNNLITTLGDTWLAGKCSDAAGLAALSDIGVGTGTTAPAVSDTGLETQLDKNALYLTPWQGVGSASNEFYVRTIFTETEAVGTLSEAGLFYSTSLFSRVLISPTVNKTSDKVLVLQWKISF